MKKIVSVSLLFIVLSFFINFAHAITPIAECPAGFHSATLDAQLTISTNLTECPILENRKLRKLVNKFGAGDVFLYPAVPGTCISGRNLTGTLTSEDNVIEVTGSSESAQRAFVEAIQINPEQGGMFMTGTSQNGGFVSGAAMTVVTLNGVHEDFNLKLVLSDRFTIDLSAFPFMNTEDFKIIGSKGRRAKGRLTGTALITGQVGEPLVDIPFHIMGNICIKGG